jgi:hypothetical protein
METYKGSLDYYSENEHWRYMQENSLDFFGNPKFKSFGEWKAANEAEAVEAKRIERVNALKRAAMLGIIR